MNVGVRLDPDTVTLLANGAGVTPTSEGVCRTSVSAPLVMVTFQGTYPKATARRYDQTWFESGERSAALAFVRSRIARARSYVLVADPYFGARQILQFLHAVPRIDVSFTILTSRLAFENEDSEPSGVSANGRNEPKTVPSSAGRTGLAREARCRGAATRRLHRSDGDIR